MTTPGGAHVRFPATGANRGSAGDGEARPPRSLVLFDIDGTLVRGGPAKESFHDAMLAEFGTAGQIDGHEFSGKTDPQIARELLRGAGLTDGAIDRGLPSLWARYLEALERRLARRPMEVLAGVRELLDTLGGVRDVALGLVTGNIVDGARLKLASVGLDDRFPIGGFGSDAEARELLPAVALRRARERWGVSFARDRVFVVGDTPRDVACGRHEGLATVAVATGGFDARALERAGADVVLDDFGNVDAVVEVLTG